MLATSLAADYAWSPDPGTDLRSLAARARDPDAPPWERDAVLRQVVLTYRGDRSWSSLLLDLLAPAMDRLLRDLEPQPPVITEVDVQQQVLVEVLEAAATIPLRPGARFVDRAIAKRARRRVVRWLQRELVHSDSTESLPDEDESEEDE